MGTDYWGNAQNYFRKCLKFAYKMNCHTYIFNSTILIGSIEFFKGFAKDARETFTLALKCAYSINEPEVLKFMKEVNFI